MVSSGAGIEESSFLGQSILIGIEVKSYENLLPP